jgi:O-antigen/teichoic acid export membrane protein
MAVYLRAHKQEPYLIPSVVHGCLVALSTLILGYKFGAVGVAIGYFIITTLIMLPEVSIFIKCRSKWHIKSSDNIKISYRGIISGN